VLDALKAELERFGEANDAATTDRARRMLNITRETGELLSVLVRAMRARRILEIGTSNGYSTLWLAEAARDIGGQVTTVEHSPFKAELARSSFLRSGLSPFIAFVEDDAALLLRRQASESIDLIFLDADRSKYAGWWPDVDRALRPGGLLVVDNALSHADQVAPFVALVDAEAGYTTSVVPVGNGELLAVKTLADRMSGR
jgi:predicted O-methyltransferase YrrM